MSSNITAAPVESLGNGVRHLWIELTNRCNLCCVHCYANSGPDVRDEAPLSFEAYRTILHDAFQQGCRSVQFIGGEPTINPLLPALVRLAHEMRYSRIEIFSNLTHLSDALLLTVKECSGQFATSFYCDLPEVHDRITQSPGSHQKTLANIKRVLAWSLPLRVGIIAMEANAARLEETKQLLATAGVKDTGVDRVRQIGRPKADGTPVKVEELCGHCWEGNLCISPSGSVSPCIMSKQWSLGQLQECSIAELARSNRLAEARDELRAAFLEKVPEPANADCSPEDRCSPRACKPQVGGPPDCYPQKACMPDLHG